MKTKLTPEQSQRLIELGVDPSKASFTVVTDEYNETSENFQHPIFGLTDIISLLPKEIEKNRGNGSLAVDILIIRWSGNFWIAGYSWRIEKSAPELIDALFELLVWCITNKHIEL